LKKHLIVLSLFIYVLLSSFLVNSLNEKLLVSTNAELENTNMYAKINKNTYLLKTPTKILDFQNAYFILEESYYVIILDLQNDYYYVQYQDIKGYVQKESLTIVNEQIESPFLENITFNIVKDTFLYQEPIFSNDLQKHEVLSGEKVKYIGKIYSQNLSDLDGNVWYYAEIENNGVKTKGYIHSSFTNNLTPITQNNSVSTEFLANNNTNTLLNIKQTTQIIIIIVLSVPIFFILYLFLKGFKKV